MSATPARAALIAYIVAGAFFMEMFDGAVIATALPRMADSFGVDTLRLGIGITAYMTTQAAFIPASGWVAERFGTRNVFAAAIGGFILASLLCGLSQGLTEFVAARLLQGAAAALMSPVGRLVILRATERAQLIRAMATITWPALIAPVVGPPIGGFITTYASWRWIFFINLPIGLAGMVLVWRFVPNQFGESRSRFDLAGFLLSAASLCCLIDGLQLVAGGDGLLAAALASAGLVIGAAAIRHARLHPAPLLDLSAMRLPTFAVTVWGGTALRVAISATPFLLPLLFQTAYGLTAFAAGLYLLAYMAGNLLMKTVTTPILRRFGFRTVLSVNGMLACLAIAACVLATPAAPILTSAILFVAGCTRSMQFTAINTVNFAEVAPAQRSGATTLSSMVQQVGFALGIAGGSIALQLAAMLRGGTAGELLPADFRLAFVMVAAVGLCGIPDFVRLHPTAGAEVSGHRRPA